MNISTDSPKPPSPTDPFELTQRVRLRNRLVATAHARAAVSDGAPSEADAEYWGRLSAGGVAMCITGGTVVSPGSTYRTRVLTEAWSKRALPGLRLRADAIRREGAAAVLQILHLGRETLGAETYYAPVAPSAVRSPREPTRPRALTDSELADIVADFRLSADHASEAGFDGIELHAAHGYLLSQLLSPTANRRPGAETVEGRVDTVMRIVNAVHAVAPELALGIRLSIGDPDDAGLTIDQVADVLALLEPAVDYVNLTVGMRADYVRDMATSRPPLLDRIAALRALTDRPLLISHGFRRPADMESALAGGADLVGMTRALIADPDLPEKLFEGRPVEIRPCVACDEDCRAFDPSLLCTVNPDLAAPGDQQRRATPLIRGKLHESPQRFAIVGAGPGGLEAAWSLQRLSHARIVVYEATNRLGGSVANVGTAPNRGGWLRLVEFYKRNLDPARVTIHLEAPAAPEDLTEYDGVILAVGSEELLPDVAADSGAQSVSAAIAAGPEALRGIDHLVVADDGFAWWPAANAVELGIAAHVKRITVVTPGTAFATALPGESRVGFLKRIRGTVPIDLKALRSLSAVAPDGVTLRSITSGEGEQVAADAVVIVGERRPRDWSAFEAALPGLVVVGDAIVPRRVAHAIAEGRAAAGTLVAGQAVAAGRTIPLAI